MKSLIYYYSWKGKTKSVAEALMKITGAELRRLEEVSIRKGILSYLISPLQALTGLKSELRPYNPNISGYERIFIGTPVWGGNPVPAINTLINEASLKRKKIVIFCTNIFGKSQPVLNKMENRIRERGGLIEGSFSIRCTKKNMANLPDLIKKTAKKYL